MALTGATIPVLRLSEGFGYPFVKGRNQHLKKVETSMKTSSRQVSYWSNIKAFGQLWELRKSFVSTRFRLDLARSFCNHSEATDQR
mmetsp:Transcript_8968/g.11662  ORF Transcript_8968/g.11662 Transcript_8968/m.11662 type:complete len:86 (+) Transcript_8968:99-356(+)